MSEEQKETCCLHWHNLLWTVTQEAIAPNAPLPWLEPSRLQGLAEFYVRPQTRPALEPLLEKRFKEYPHRRLGIYFEDLCAFIFEHHPDYRLLARNLPIRDSGKTLGELDFVLEYLPEQAIEHWEVAVKFYLQVRDGTGQTVWVGPGLRDRLDVKLARMANHQFPIATDDRATALLLEKGMAVSRHCALVPGRLFHHYHQQQPHATHGTHRNWWTDLDSFLDEDSECGELWRPLKRTEWLADLHQVDDATPSRAEAAKAVNSLRRPVCIAQIDHSGTEITRGFVTPADWPDRAQRTLQGDRAGTKG
ncbi:DUF1853 family protein [Biformimicrobium ophioploci]|uniref:DUF1853 family protein n=1 Tax=Biformimicrobium ophioploci TaxID=3036711 RepID=A0ABQ6LZF3_9GAMM|nr:DUF1853 family protein [Microbulbifer sp. NKW57]GMG87489.1 DUF1853 family protein [Microbulbifer sp. NKW57]